MTTLTDLQRLREAATPLHWRTFRDGGCLVTDVAFYRAAHKHLPELLDEIERLRKQIDDLNENLDSVCGYCDALKAEIERLRDELETQTVGHRGAVDGWNEARAERDALKAENKYLIEHLKLAEKIGVSEGLFDLEDCGWYTGDEE